MIAYQKRLNAALRLKQAEKVDFALEAFNGELKDQQTVGSAFLIMIKRGMLLDYVGAGKTPMTIGAHTKLAELGKVKRALIVCESAQTKHWVDEYKKFTDMDVVLVRGTKRQRQAQWLEGHSSHVTVAYYEAVRSDIDTIIQLDWDILVFDEATYFKTMDTVLAHELRRLTTWRPDAFEYRWALSATPIEKKLVDIFAIMEKISPGVLGNYVDFIDDHVIMKTFRPKRGGTFTKVVGYKNLELVKQKLAPYFIRRTKRVDNRFRLNRWIELEGKQRRAYNKIKEGISLDDNRLELFQKFRQLEYACDGMFYFDEKDKKSQKLDDLMFLLENDLSEEKVVVFGKYHKILDELQRRLERANIGFVRYTGRESQDERDWAQQQFLHDPQVQVIIVTTAAARGINLHSARYIAFLNRQWNPAIEEQLIGRIDREHLQTSPWIMPIFFVCRNTVEETLNERMEKEGSLDRQMFGGEEKATVVESMNTDDLYRLVKHNKLGNEDAD